MCSSDLTPEGGLLSFDDLLQVAVLRGIRTKHSIQLPYIRKAKEIAQRELGIERLLLSPELRAGAGSLFLAKYGELLELSAAEQFAMESIFKDFLHEFVDFKRARFFPKERTTNGRKLILVTPFIGFGRPVISRLGVSTSAIVERVNAGEKQDEIIKDYALTIPEFEEAISYETLAA